MSKRYHQGDIVHVEALVEVDPGDDNVNLVFKGTNGVEHRQRVPKAVVRHHERGPVKAGDHVRKRIKTGTVEGLVMHREGDMAWVLWGEDAHSIETVTSLMR